MFGMLSGVSDTRKRRRPLWTRRWPVFVSALVLLFALLLTGTGSVLTWCPVCGGRGSYSYIQVLGVSLSGGAEWNGPCLSEEHRPLLTSRTFSLWWQGGYSHYESSAANLHLRHRLAIGTWLETANTSAPQRKQVIRALEKASVEQLATLSAEYRPLASEEILSWAEAVLAGHMR